MAQDLCCFVFHLNWRPYAKQCFPLIHRLFILIPLGVRAFSVYFFEQTVNASFMGTDGGRADGSPPRLGVGTRDMDVIASEPIRCKLGRRGLRLRSAV